MDDIKIIIYILAAVAYFVFTQWRKAFNSPSDQDEAPRPQPKRSHPQQPARPATSFEDILRELQPKVDRGRVATETVWEYTPPVVAVEERTPKYKNYEGEVNRALSWENAAEAREARKRAEVRRQPIFKAYAQETEAPTSRYAKMLQNPASARDAVILSEIFNRKF